MSTMSECFNDYRWIYMIYCVKEEAPNQWVCLNRKYKPLGMDTLEHIDYSLYTREGTINESDQRSLSHRGNLKDRDGIIWLYTTSTIPTRNETAYQEYVHRLEILRRVFGKL
jgi:hypothetical protein